MDIKPEDEFELEERPDEDADDEFAGTLPGVSEEAETSFDDLSTIRYEVERANTNAEEDTFYDSFPGYKVDITIKIRNKTTFSLEHKTNRLRIRDGGRFVYLSSEKKSK